MCESTSLQGPQISENDFSKSCLSVENLPEDAVTAKRSNKSQINCYFVHHIVQLPQVYLIDRSKVHQYGR